MRLNRAHRRRLRPRRRRADHRPSYCRSLARRVRQHVGRCVGQSRPERSRALLPRGVLHQPGKMVRERLSLALHLRHPRGHQRPLLRGDHQVRVLLPAGHRLLHQPHVPLVLLQRDRELAQGPHAVAQVEICRSVEPGRQRPPRQQRVPARGRRLAGREDLPDRPVDAEAFVVRVGEDLSYVHSALIQPPHRRGDVRPRRRGQDRFPHRSRRQRLAQQLLPLPGAVAGDPLLVRGDLVPHGHGDLADTRQQLLQVHAGLLERHHLLGELRPVRALQQGHRNVRGQEVLQFLLRVGGRLFGGRQLLLRALLLPLLLPSDSISDGHDQTHRHDGALHRLARRLGERFPLGGCCHCSSPLVSGPASGPWAARRRAAHACIGAGAPG